jgi:hypothetical protein
MDTIQDQIRELQTSVRRQRFAIFALASVLTGIALIGAVRPAGDATFDTITCKAWKVVDADGRQRINAGTFPDGFAGVKWSDGDGKERIVAVTTPGGLSFVSLNGGDGKNRIIALTSDGDLAHVSMYDFRGNARITASTRDILHSAGVQWRDYDGKICIVAETAPTGAVTYPTKDGK